MKGPYLGQLRRKDEEDEQEPRGGRTKSRRVRRYYIAIRHRFTSMVRIARLMIGCRLNPSPKK